MVTLDLQIYQTKFTVKQLKKVKKELHFLTKKKTKDSIFRKDFKKYFFP